MPKKVLLAWRQVVIQGRMQTARLMLMSHLERNGLCDQCMEYLVEPSLERPLGLSLARRMSVCHDLCAIRDHPPRGTGSDTGSETHHVSADGIGDAISNGSVVLHEPVASWECFIGRAMHGGREEDSDMPFRFEWGDFLHKFDRCGAMLRNLAGDFRSGCLIRVF